MRLELTRLGDYGIRAMLELATDPDRDWLSVPRISAAMNIPERVLPRAMTQLVRAGLVEGRPGRSGGYRLAKPSTAITLLDVIVAVEPAPDARSCVLRGSPCGLDGTCVVHDAFTDAREAMLQRLGTITLDDVTRRKPA